MEKLFRKLYDIIIGIVAITISGGIQVFLWMFIVMAFDRFWKKYVSKDQWDNTLWMLVTLIVLIINGLAFFEYYRFKRHGAYKASSISKLTKLVSPLNPGAITRLIFYIPNSVDRILTGSNLYMKEAAKTM